MSNQSTALQRLIDDGHVRALAPVRVSLDDGCEVTAQPYLEGDNVHLEIECRDGMLRSVFGDVEMDGKIHVKTSVAAFERMVLAAKAAGLPQRVSRFLSETIHRGPPLLR